MNRRITILGSAEREIEEAYLWYEGRELGLGERFLYEVDSALRRIAQYPSGYGVVQRAIRRAGTHRFPYGIYYVFNDDEIAILSLHDDRRDDVRFVAYLAEVYPDA